MSEALIPLLALLVKSTLTVFAAGLLVATLKALRVAAATRHFVWLMAFAMVALLPLFGLVLPQIVVALPYSALGIATPDLSTPGEHVPDRDSLVWIWGVYALGAGLMLARLLTARLALAALWRRARPHNGAEIDELAPACSVRGALELRIADMPVAPLTWGRRVLLPPDAADWDASRVRDVLLHELSHVARRDSLTQLLAAIARAFFWFSPGVWFALRALRVEQEHACDERVLATGVEPVGYARTLLDVAASVQAPTLGMGVSTAMVQRSDLERRVIAVLAPARGRTLGFMRTAAIGAVLLAASALVAAAQPFDSARMLRPLARLSDTSQLEPMSARLAPLSRLTGRIRMPDEQKTDGTR